MLIGLGDPSGLIRISPVKDSSGAFLCKIYGGLFAHSDFWLIFEVSNKPNDNDMRINGRKLTEKEQLNYYRGEKRKLIGEVITEAVHNELKFLNGRIFHLSTKLKIKSLEDKKRGVRNAQEFNKIGAQIDKLQKLID